MSVRRVMISGHATLGRETAVRSAYEILTIIAAVEVRHGVIVDVSINLVTETARTFVRDMLLGVSVSDPIEPLMDEFSTDYHGSAKKSIASAIRALFASWIEVREQHKTAW